MSASFCSIFLLMENDHLKPLTYRAAINVLLILTPYLVMLSRVYLKYHTVTQVFAGYFFGLILGYIWWKISDICQTYISNLISSIFNLLAFFDNFPIIKMLAL